MTATHTRGSLSGNNRGANGGDEFIISVRTAASGLSGTNGELLQALNYLCNKRLCSPPNILCSTVPNTLVTLTHPHPLVTFRLKPFFSGV
jgi:hypothetical protein